MADGTCDCVLEKINTGIKGPLYSDGAVVHASDLTLDRDSHTQALWRMRRLLHGWGIVAGLQLSVVLSERGYIMTVQNGYGVAPDGEELFLPSDVTTNQILERMFDCCGPSDPGCKLDETGRPVPPAPGPERTRLAVWVVLKSEWVPAAPRPGLPLDCEHPGNAMFPTRSCNRVTVELRCGAPDGHVTPPPDCAKMRSVICDGSPVPMSLAEAEGGLLVLGRLVWDGRMLSVDQSVRQRLLPVAVIQQFLTACLCERSEPPIEDDDDDDDDNGGGGRPPILWGDEIIVANPGIVGTVREAEYKGIIARLQARQITVNTVVDSTPVDLMSEIDITAEQARWFINTTRLLVKGREPVINPGPSVPLRRFVVTHDAGERLGAAERDIVTRPSVIAAAEEAGVTVTDIIRRDGAELEGILGINAEEVQVLKRSVGKLEGMGPRVRF